MRFYFLITCLLSNLLKRWGEVNYITSRSEGVTILPQLDFSLYHLACIKEDIWLYQSLLEIVYPFIDDYNWSFFFHEVENICINTPKEVYIIQTRSHGLSSPPSPPTPGVHSYCCSYTLTLPGHVVLDAYLTLQKKSFIPVLSWTSTTLKNWKRIRKFFSFFRFSSYQWSAT